MAKHRHAHRVARRPRAVRDEGFTLTEVMIAMLLMLLVLLAMISVVVVALTVTAENATRSTASEAVQARIEEARRQSVAGSCDVIEGVVYASETFEDGRGVPITVSGEIASPGCERKAAGEESDPAQVVRVTVTATSMVDGTSTPTAEVTTDIFMKPETP